MTRLFVAPRGRHSLARLARQTLMVGVIVGLLAVYQHYFQTVLEQIEAKGTVADPAGILTDADTRWLMDQAALLRARFGLELLVRLGGDATAAAGPDPNDPKKVFVYGDPGCQASRVAVPPLVASGLPPGFAADLGREHLDAACRQGRAREGLLATVGLLIDALAHAADRAKGEDT